MKVTTATATKWTKELVFVIIMCQLTLTKSDFNVVIPEVCTIPDTIKVNLTWIHDMVLSGIHHDDQNRQSQFSLNILGPEGNKRVKCIFLLSLFSPYNKLCFRFLLIYK